MSANVAPLLVTTVSFVIHEYVRLTNAIDKVYATHSFSHSERRPDKPMRLPRLVNTVNTYYSTHADHIPNTHNTC
jgi:hypothetical protein